MGSQDSQTKSEPVSAAQRLETYLAGQNAIQADTSNYGGQTYVAPQYEGLGNGDYETVRTGLNATTQRQQDQALKANDQAMSDRGIYTSLNALRSNDSTREGYASQFAANDATVEQMKADDLKNKNATNMENANRRYESSWRPADYKAGLWNGTGGVISSGSSGGFSI